MINIVLLKNNLSHNNIITLSNKIIRIKRVNYNNYKENNNNENNNNGKEKIIFILSLILCIFTLIFPIFSHKFFGVNILEDKYIKLIFNCLFILSFSFSCYFFCIWKKDFINNFSKFGIAVTFFFGGNFSDSSEDSPEGEANKDSEADWEKIEDNNSEDDWEKIEKAKTNFCETRRTTSFDDMSQANKENIALEDYLSQRSTLESDTENNKTSTDVSATEAKGNSGSHSS